MKRKKQEALCNLEMASQIMRNLNPLTAIRLILKRSESDKAPPPPAALVEEPETLPPRASHGPFERMSKRMCKLAETTRHKNEMFKFLKRAKIKQATPKLIVMSLLFLLLSLLNTTTLLGCSAEASDPLVAIGTPASTGPARVGPTTDEHEQVKSTGVTDRQGQSTSEVAGSDDSPAATTTTSSTTTTTSSTSAPKFRARVTTMSSFNDDSDDDEDAGQSGDSSGDRITTEDESSAAGGYLPDWLTPASSQSDEQPTQATSESPSASDRASIVTGTSMPDDENLPTASSVIQSLDEDGASESDGSTSSAASPAGSEAVTPPSQQLIRSRKSPENATTHANPSGRNGTNFFGVANQTPSTIDYDDFDLDYQLKLGPGAGEQTPPAAAAMTSNTTTAFSVDVNQQQQQQGSLSKRDYDSNHMAPPAWSALLADQPHLFKSSAAATTSQLNSTAAVATTGSSQQHTRQAPPVPTTTTAATTTTTTTGSPTAAIQTPPTMYHNTPPIMPSLLTIKSAQLTNQELNKVRPHFLLYPDQYSEFSGPNSYHSASEALANGDLLATASNSDHLQQALFASLSGSPIGNPNQTAGFFNQTSTPPGPGQNSTASGGGGSNSTASQMISLLNGSPILNKQSLFDNLVHHQSMMSPLNGLTNGSKLNKPRLTLAGGNSASSDGSSSQPQVTTIVVDNSVPTTQMPQVVHSTIATPINTSAGSTTTSAPSATTTTTLATTTSATGGGGSMTTSRSTLANESRWQGTSNQPVPTTNSSQAHQWFNYPHPNLHHNPLLLHHILNKPSSFYAQNTASATGAAPSSTPFSNPGNGQGSRLSPVSLLTTTTTEMPVPPLPQITSPPPPTPQQQSPAPPPRQNPPVVTSIVPSYIQQPSTPGPAIPPAGGSVASAQSNVASNIIERPTFGSQQHIQQQPVNLTLLQMQLNEMRAIAAQENSPHLRPFHQQQQQQQQPLGHFPLGQTSPRSGPAPWMVPTQMMQPPVNMLHHLVGGNMSPQMHQVPPSNFGVKDLAMGVHGPAPHIMALHHHHHLPGKQVPISGMSASAGLQFVKKPQSPLVSQIIGAPSFLQEVYTPSPPLQYPQPQQQHQQQQHSLTEDFNKALLANQTATSHLENSYTNNLFDSLSVAASVPSGQSMSDSHQMGANQTAMSDEDMSTYVALLASLNASGHPGVAPAPVQPTKHHVAESQQSGTGSTSPEQEQLNNLLESILLATGNNKSRPSHTAKDQQEVALLDLDQLQHQNPALQNNLQAQSWIELLKGAKLIGLSEEVQAEIYREYLAPLVTSTGAGPQQQTTTSTTKRPSQQEQMGQFLRQVNRTPQMIANYHQKLTGAPAESSNQMQTFVAPTITTSPSVVAPPPAKASNDQRNFYSLEATASPSASSKQQQHVEMLKQRQRQMAFIEAIRLSLVQMANANESTLSNEQSGMKPIKDLAETPSEFDEALANSSSRPQPDWLQFPNEMHGLARPSMSGHLSVADLASSQSSPLPGGGRPSLFPGMRAPLLRAPPMSLLRPLGPSAAGGSSSPVPIYPLRSLWNSRHHYSSGGTGGSGPQPRLLWPVYPPPPRHHSLLASSGSQPPAMISPGEIPLGGSLRPQSTIPVPLIRLGPQPAHLQSAGPLQPPSMSLTPNRVMLDRFPMAAAPAYLVKLPTLTGGTITASGSLVPPMPKFLRRPPPGYSIPPAAFISASPIGALRFLSALTPPRMRLIQPAPHPSAAFMQSPPGISYTGGGLQSAPSMLHVGHSSPLAHIHGSPVSPYLHHHHLHHQFPTGYSAHLHPLSHLHHHHSHHSQAASSPPRLQIYVGGNGPPADMVPSAQSSLDSPTATTTTTTTISSAGSGDKQQANGGQSTQAASGSGGEQQQQAAQQQQQNPNALTRLQQATLSLVELSSLASLLDEVVGGSDTETSPAIALANAINSLSAAQNAAAASNAQATATQTSERIVPSTGALNGNNNNNAAQQQQVSNSRYNQQAGALFWRNLLMPGLFRQPTAGGNGAAGKFGSGKFRDFSALERLLAHTQAIGSPHGQQTARLKVKYIRVPVAVYETTPANGGGSTSSLNLVNPNGSPGTTLSTGSSEGGSGDSTGAGPDGTRTSTSASAAAAAAAAAAHGTASASPATSPTSNEYLFDEMSSESGPQTHYLHNHHPHAQFGDGGGPTATGHLGYLPIVRPVGSHNNQKSPLEQAFMFKPRLPLGALEGHGAAGFLSGQDMGSLESGSFYSLSPAASTASAAVQSLLEEESKASSSSKKKKKRGRKGKKKDEDDEDEEEEEDDDDALSPNDLPIIESLISTIIHGPPQSPVGLASAAQDPLATSASNGWRSMRTRRPFGFGRNRNAAQQLSAVAPEASSNIYSYAHPGEALSSAGRLTNPFHRQRFSLGEVVGALGAKKLISNLLGRRTKTARTSNRHPQAPAVGQASSAPTSVGFIRHGSRSKSPSSASESSSAGGGDSSTRMPPRDLLLLPFRGHAHSFSGSNSSPMKRNLFRWPTRSLRPGSNSTSAGGQSSQGNNNKTWHGGKPTAETFQAVTFSPLNKSKNGDEWSTTTSSTTRKPQPLVYASMAAYDFDSSLANSRNRRLKRSTTPKPASGPTMDASIVSAGPATSSPASPSPGSPPRASMISESSSTNQDKLEYNFYMNNRRANQSSSSPHATRTTTAGPVGNRNKLASVLQFGAQKRHKDSSGDTLANATVIQLFTGKPAAPATGAPSSRASPMPLYHIVADHYNKVNAGHDLGDSPSASSSSSSPARTGNKSLQVASSTTTTTTTTSTTNSPEPSTTTTGVHSSSIPPPSPRRTRRSAGRVLDR